MAHEHVRALEGVTRRRVLTMTIGVAGAGWYRETEHAAPSVVWRVRGEGRGTPAMDASTVYFLSRRHEVVAVGREDGRIRWRRETGAKGPETLGSRVVRSGAMVVVADGDLVAFDAATGSPRWRADCGHLDVGPYCGDLCGRVICTGSAAGTVFAIDTSNGTERWSRTLTPGDAAVAYAPVASGDVVAVSFGSSIRDGAGVALLDSSTGHIRWRVPFAGAGAPNGPSGGPVFWNDVVIAADRRAAIHAFDRRDGRARWLIADRVSPPGPTEFRALALSGQTLVAGSLSGVVTAYDLVRRHERWRYTGTNASVAFNLASDGRTVYVPYLSGHLVALDVETGAERWRTPAGSDGFAWAPLPAGSHVFGAASSAGFFALRA